MHSYGEILRDSTARGRLLVGLLAAWQIMMARSFFCRNTAISRWASSKMLLCYSGRAWKPVIQIQEYPYTFIRGDRAACIHLINIHKARVWRANTLNRHLYPCNMAIRIPWSDVVIAQRTVLSTVKCPASVLYGTLSRWGHHMIPSATALMMTRDIDRIAETWFGSW